MAKPNKKQIERLLAEGATLTAEINEIAAIHAEALAPIEEHYQASIKRANERFAKTAAEVRSARADELDIALKRRSEIEAEIRRELELGINGTEVLLDSVSFAGAKAAVEATRTEATCDPQALLAAVPEVERDVPFWACLKVQVQNARKLLGKKFEDIASVKKSFAVKITW